MLNSVTLNVMQKNLYVPHVVKRFELSCKFALECDLVGGGCDDGGEDRSNGLVSIHLLDQARDFL